MVQGLREAFPLRGADASVARALSGEAGLKGPGPIFVVGLPRSGSTLVEQIVASHPLVFGAGAPPAPCMFSNCLPWECMAMEDCHSKEVRCWTVLNALPSCLCCHITGFCTAIQASFEV